MQSRCSSISEEEDLILRILSLKRCRDLGYFCSFPSAMLSFLPPCPTGESWNTIQDVEKFVKNQASQGGRVWFNKDNLIAFEKVYQIFHQMLEWNLPQNYLFEVDKSMQKKFQRYDLYLIDGILIIRDKNKVNSVTDVEDIVDLFKDQYHEVREVVLVFQQGAERSKKINYYIPYSLLQNTFLTHCAMSNFFWTKITDSSPLLQEFLHEFRLISHHLPMIHVTDTVPQILDVGTGEYILQYSWFSDGLKQEIFRVTHPDDKGCDF